MTFLDLLRLDAGTSRNVSVWNSYSRRTESSTPMGRYFLDGALELVSLADVLSRYVAFSDQYPRCGSVSGYADWGASNPGDRHECWFGQPRKRNRAMPCNVPATDGPDPRASPYRGSSPSRFGKWALAAWAELSLGTLWKIPEHVSAQSLSKVVEFLSQLHLIPS